MCLHGKEEVMKLERGVNLGGYLSQCEHSRKHYEEFINRSDIEKISTWGFDHVRLPIDYEVLEQEDGTPIEEGYAIVERAVKWCEEFGLSIVLDLHKAFGYDFNDAGDAEKNNLFQSEELQARFVNLWDKISSRFCGYDNVSFELLNEVVEENNAEAWNKLIAQTVKAIRSNAPDSYIIYGGIQWNSAKTLKLLEKPNDDKIIFTFHFYEPLLFTHQKAYWVPTMDPAWNIEYPGDIDDYIAKSKIIGDQGKAVVECGLDKIGVQLIDDLVQDAINAAKNAGVGLYCGEFGVIDRAPVEDTKRWFDDVNEVFSKYGIRFCIWNYKEKDFGLAGSHYDSVRDELLNIWNKK
ncbi:MAG: glycoside hydrolase family 5 protein [Lachnospiraceae bacterium]|jgi:aryl-phospho-beta-D-glucosidase BglC (GH1 family)|nr:glycoside hydrolase family 5 protein [Lachnospiraceae bacterium]